MTDQSTQAKELLFEAGGNGVSPSPSEILHAFITDRLPAAGEPLAEAAAHHFAAPGKMLRPLLVTASGRLATHIRSPTTS